MKPQSGLWRHHILIISTISYICGIALSHRIEIDRLILTGGLLILCAAATAVWLSGRNRSAIALLCFVFLSFGFGQAQAHRIPRLAPDHIARQVAADTEAVVVGRLARMVVISGDVSRALIDVHFIRPAGHDRFVPGTGRLLLNVSDVWPAGIEPGDSCAARTTVRLPRGPTTPGTFDYHDYLARQGIHLIATVSSALLVQPAAPLPAAPAQQLSAYIERLRGRIGARLDRILPERSAALYRALLIGDRSRLDRAQIDSFIAAGVFHILAISGMHLGLLACLIFSCLAWTLKRSETVILHLDVSAVAIGLTILPLIFYALLTGARPPVLRALTMTIFAGMALIANRRRSPFAILAGAAFVILLVDPLALATPSFQLSFAAVAAIMALIPVLADARAFARCSQGPGDMTTVFRRIGAAVLALGLVTIAATVGTAPLLLHHFNRISLVALPANLIVEPLVCLFSLPLGFAGLALLFVAPAPAAALLKVGAIGLDAAALSADFLAGLNGAERWLPAPAPGWVALYYIALLIIAVRPGRRTLRLAAGLMLTVAVIAFAAPATPFLPATGRQPAISFIDVGHGSASLVEFGSGRTVLIDGGSKRSPPYDCGVRVIAPFLLERRIARLDDVVVTHDDADHYNGISTIIERFRPRRLWLPYRTSAKAGFRDLLAQAAAGGTEVRIPVNGTVLDEPAGRLRFITGAPPRAEVAETGRAVHLREDDDGLVVRVELNGVAALFPGDISRAREKELIRAGERLQAELLLSAHHGSSTSNSAAFLAAVDPDYLIVSASSSGRGLFPSAQTTATAEQLNIELITTAVHGTVIAVIDAPGRFRIAPPLQEPERRWR